MGSIVVCLVHLINTGTKSFSPEKLDKATQMLKIAKLPLNKHYSKHKAYLDAAPRNHGAR